MRSCGRDVIIEECESGGWGRKYIGKYVKHETSGRKKMV